MPLVISTTLRIHASARARFTDWATQRRQSFASLKAELESAQGLPTGAFQLENGRWLWAFGTTFVSYVIKDEPVTLFGVIAPLSFFVDRRVVVMDIFAV